MTADELIEMLTKQLCEALDAMDQLAVDDPRATLCKRTMPGMREALAAAAEYAKARAEPRVYLHGRDYCKCCNVIADAPPEPVPHDNVARKRERIEAHPECGCYECKLLERAKAVSDG